MKAENDREAVGRCQWCDRERPTRLMRKWNEQWQCQDWIRCASVARKRRD